MTIPVDKPATMPSLVVMGVSGCGKTSVGRRAAGLLDWPFLEGDSLHSRHNVEKMRRGHALDDADRAPWLEAIAAWVAARAAEGGSGVIACSALRRSYRDVLRSAQRELRFAWLHAERSTLLERLQHRPDHFMPARLLDSQLDTLEAPQQDEIILRLDAGADIDTLAAAAAAYAGKN